MQFGVSDILALITRGRRPLIYAIGVSLSAFFSLLTFRLLWRTMPVDDFSTWVLVDPILTALASTTLLGSDHAIARRIRGDLQDAGDVLGELASGYLPVFFLLALAGCLILLANLDKWIGAACFIVGADALLLLSLSTLRAAGNSEVFSLINISRSFLPTAVIYTFSIMHTVSIGDALFIRAVTTTIVAGSTLLYLRPNFSLPRTHIIDDVIYGLPLTLSSLIFSFADTSDRWGLALVASPSTVAVYSVHIKVAAILSQGIVAPFALWFPPERFRRSHDQDGGKHFFRVTALCVLTVSCFVAALIWINRSFIFSLIAPGSHCNGLILALSLAAVVCLAMSQALNVGLLLPGQTSKNVMPFVLMFGQTFVLSLALSPLFGGDGAAIARLTAFCVATMLILLRSQRVYSVPFSYATMIWVLTSTISVAKLIDIFVDANILVPRTFLLLFALLVCYSLPVSFALLRK